MVLCGWDKVVALWCSVVGIKLQLYGVLCLDKVVTLWYSVVGIKL